MSGRGGHRGGRGIICSGGGFGGRRNFAIRNNQNKSQELKFYPHGTGLDRQTAEIIKVKYHIILKIESKFLNGSDIEESIHK